MKYDPYLALNAWLHKSDWNYMEGRMLWLNSCTNGAANLFWLSLEQMIKIVLLQKDIPVISAGEQDLARLQTTLDRMAHNMGNNPDKLMIDIHKQYPYIKSPVYGQLLTKLKELHMNRYYINSLSDIRAFSLDIIDKLFFTLRILGGPELGISLIDEIHIMKKHGWPYPLSVYKYAHLNNTEFRPRRHNTISVLGPDGKQYPESGS